MTSDKPPLRVYCAGPLFNQMERDEMTAIADALIAEGYGVYLPHRDGMEFRLIHHELIQNGWEAATAGQFLHAAIFALDVYQLVVECECMVWNLNGRTPDEGAVSEAAMAWMLGKPLVAFTNDARTLIAGRINPLLVGMVDFQTVDDIAAIPPALASAISREQPVPSCEDRLPPAVQNAVAAGRTLWETLCQYGPDGDNAAIAEAVAGLFAPREESSVET